ncbi:uncharacterized protein LOC125681310 isoform X2 [Ostrea edulis]|nr:uncharacterized protein LOC125681310 isoform X2 [Ostrea edulis]
MEPSDPDKKEVRRPMNAFLIFCKRHRSMVREKNPNLDNRNVTRILGDLWANLKEEEKTQYTDLAKQYKDAFMKANPDYKWHNPEKGMQPAGLLARSPIKGMGQDNFDFSRAEQTITPGKLADPSDMGGLSLLFMAGQQNPPKAAATNPAVHLSREKMTYLESGRNSSHESQNGSGRDEGCSPEKEDKNTVLACGKMVMDSIIDQLYYSKLDASADQDGAQPRKGPFTTLTEKQKERSLLHDLSVSRDELERKLLLGERMNRGSGMDVTESAFVNPMKSTMPVESDMNRSQMLQWSGYKRKRCYSEGFKDTPEMNTLQPFVNPFYKKGDSSCDLVDEDGESDLQPVRKSKRRNRGQRYQELINEGIIQPSKDRQGISKSPEEAIKEEQMTVQRESVLREDDQVDLNPRDHLRFDVLSVYPRQIRKRTQSESEKVRLEDSSRYKTGDFDLEAHIATLPACSLEKVTKPKKTAPKLRTASESRTFSTSSDSSSATEVKLTIPPHLKVKAEDIPSEPVVGSRKRKARKHSITHLMPVNKGDGCVKNSTTTNEENSRVDMKETKDVKFGEETDFTRIKKGSDRLDSENNNNSSDRKSQSQRNEDSKGGINVAEARMQDIVGKITERKEEDASNYLYASQENVNKSGGRDHFQENIKLKDNSSSSDGLAGGGGSASAISMEEDTSQILGKSRDTGVDNTAGREITPKGLVKLDTLHVGNFSDMDKIGIVGHSLEIDSSESFTEEANTVSGGQVKGRQGDNLSEGQVKGRQGDNLKGSDHLNTDTNMETKGISQNNRSQPCGNQVAEVISFHLDDTRGERSQFTSQNNPLQTAVVNS